jgi:hypothetical protein
MSTTLGRRSPISMPKMLSSRLRLAVVFLETTSVANSYAHGEHQTPPWTSSLSMYLRVVERKDSQIPKRNSLLNLHFLKF